MKDDFSKYSNIPFIFFGYGDDVYQDNKDNKERLREIIIDLISAVEKLQDVNYEWESYSRPIFIEQGIKFLKKYNTRCLWMN